MEYRELGNTGTDVSVICLGTMTYGEQNTEAEAFEQMDYAVAQGIIFFDTAELYSIPPKAETYGRTEEIIGDWFKARADVTGGVMSMSFVTGSRGPGQTGPGSSRAWAARQAIMPITAARPPVMARSVRIVMRYDTRLGGHVPKNHSKFAKAFCATCETPLGPTVCRPNAPPARAK